jgi:hypothetical protein
MYQIDVPSASPLLPAPAALGTAGFFTDGDVAGGIEPTVLPADFLNALMLELLNILTAVGLVPSKTQNNQILLAIEQLIEARSGNYALDIGGVANAYVIALSPAIAAYQNGTTVRFRTSRANLAGATLDAGAGAAPLLREDGAALSPGDITSNSITVATYVTAAGGFLVNEIVRSQLGALAKEGVGQGLEDDGAGNLRVKLADGSMRRTASGVQANDPIASVGANQAPTAMSHMTSYVATAAISFTMPATASLWNGFCLPIYAKGGAVTFIPNAGDAVDGNAAGQSYTLLQGQNAEFVTDGAGNWWPFFKTTAVGSTPPKYINSAQTLGPGVYLTDTSAAAFAITLSASPVLGDCLELIDGPGTWSANNLTINRNGKTIMGSAENLTCNVGGEDFRIWYNGTDWRLE